MRLAWSVPLVTLLLVCAVEIRGHGRLRVPPSRTSMWRDGFGTPANFGDNQLSCGGAWVSTMIRTYYILTCYRELSMRL